MLSEVLTFLQEKPLKTFFEGTLGAGGHARAILEGHPEIQTYIACDQDPEALEIAKGTLSQWKEKVKFVHTNFSDLDNVLQSMGINQVDGFFLIWGSRQCSWIKEKKVSVFQKRGP